ncbi:hypothetical protein L6452_44346 [Arctium lappa]|uniref:Uncharacterized protein n=1 Tax=Arctium lappa TaxID=4217 RepID=A0ACB8XFX5_ARCLA|nr:hypothetical protein L6452_44346 [Arctium lappa]
MIGGAGRPATGVFSDKFRSADNQLLPENKYLPPYTFTIKLKHDDGIILDLCSKGVGEVVVVDTVQVGMRTRAVAAATEEEGGEKRRKVGKGELRLPLPTLVQITTAEEDIRDPCAAAVSRSCDHVHVPVACCSRNRSTEELQFTDLEEIVEIGAVSRCNLNTRARSKSKLVLIKSMDHSFRKPRSDQFKARSGEQETITAKPSTVIKTRRTVPAEKMPPAAELEDFFASAETELHKRFKDKYNYDIVNDTPLEGRFQWVQVLPLLSVCNSTCVRTSYCFRWNQNKEEEYNDRCVLLHHTLSSCCISAIPSDHTNNDAITASQKLIMVDAAGVWSVSGGLGGKWPEFGRLGEKEMASGVGGRRRYK